MFSFNVYVQGRVPITRGHYGPQIVGFPSYGHPDLEPSPHIKSIPAPGLGSAEAGRLPHGQSERQDHPGPALCGEAARLAVVGSSSMGWGPLKRLFAVTGLPA